MSPLVYRIHCWLSRVLSSVGAGTNLDLFLLLWTVLSGRLLGSRGALFPALADFGLTDDAVRRSQAALGTGVWSSAALIESFDKAVAADRQFQRSTYGGYHPVAADLTAFFRPRLQGCATKHYCAEAGKALPAVRFGLVGRVGAVGSQRLAVPLALVRSDPKDPRETAHRLRLLKAARECLAPDDLLVLDRGFPLSEILQAPLDRFVVRLASNFTARRATPPPYGGRGRPATKGALVRPLARRYGNRETPATPPDRTETWTVTDGKTSYELRAEIWEDLRLKGAEGGPATVRFRVLAIYDPRHRAPLLLATPQALTGDQARSHYLDRWPVEGLPQSAKGILGAGRQFVSGPESRHRLPELLLLGGALMSYLAATEPAGSSGFWDRCPRPTGGRLRRRLANVHFDNLGEIPREFRRKDSPTAHLPKGVDAHRRHKPSCSPAPRLSAPS